ncbi:MAG: hypothetical protein ACLFMU_01360 [Bacteroidales bacterium]
MCRCQGTRGENPRHFHHVRGRILVFSHTIEATAKSAAGTTANPAAGTTAKPAVEPRGKQPGFAFIRYIP